MERLKRKWQTAKKVVPKPEITLAKGGGKYGVIFYGTSLHSAREALDGLAEAGIVLDSLRLRAFPFNSEVDEFISSHEKVFVIEQNRDAQMRSLLINECGTNPEKLIRVLEYGGMPITARAIYDRIRECFKKQNLSSREAA
jgi:2-oxoglutarate ferredoxin oxidoreductase subunit alpha